MRARSSRSAARPTKKLTDALVWRLDWGDHRRRRLDTVAPVAGAAVDLMEALRRSVGGTAAETKAPKKVAKKPRKASAGQKEMLIPIPGKKQTKETAAKKPVAPQYRP
jgi:hypothetical protein